MRPTVNILYLPGTNCHAETLRAFRQVGADARLVFMSDVLSGAARLDSADILCIPGGFSFGDHLGAGSVAGLLLRTTLARQFSACLGRPLIGICNGFQIAMRAGCFGDGITLRANASGTFNDRPDQPHRVAAGNSSPWLAGLRGEVLSFPCAHGEGRLLHDGAAGRAGWNPALLYPHGENPDGSQENLAGVTSANGLVFGLMNHPERAHDPHVRLAFFENGVRAVGSVRGRSAPARVGRPGAR